MTAPTPGKQAETSFSSDLVSRRSVLFARSSWMARPWRDSCRRRTFFQLGLAGDRGDRPDSDQCPALRRDVRGRRMLYEKNGRTVHPGSGD